MTIRPLIQTKSAAVIPGDATAGLKGFVPVTYSPEFVEKFKIFFSNWNVALYNHSPIYPWAYLSKGQYRLFINEDWDCTRAVKMIPVVQHNFTEPSYYLYSPLCSVAALYEVTELLNAISKDPVEIIDCTEELANWIERATDGNWKKVKTGDDIIQNAEAIVNLAGRNFSSIRNALKHVRNDSQPRIERLDRYTSKDAIKVFQDWKELQGKKYFRVTVGRDIRLVEECAEWVDEEDFFGYVYYADGYPVGANFGSRSWSNREWGIDVTCKANVEFKGMGDFCFQHLVSQMYKKGIKYINDCVFASPGDRISKGKWSGGKELTKIPHYRLVPNRKSV